jgi:transposase
MAIIKPKSLKYLLLYCYQEKLRELVDRKSSLQHMLQQEKNRLEKNPGPAASRSLQTVIRCLQKQIELIESQLQALQEDSAEFNERVERLCQIQAISSKSAWNLLAHMPELGTLSDKEASSLAGLAPVPDDSGKHQGKRKIQHGRLPIRRTLYMCAVASIRHNPILREFYQRLKQSGKPTKVAITALMRKLIVLCNRVLRDPCFQPA